MISYKTFVNFWLFRNITGNWMTRFIVWHICILVGDKMSCNKNQTFGKLSKHVLTEIKLWKILNFILQKTFNNHTSSISYRAMVKNNIIFNTIGSTLSLDYTLNVNAVKINYGIVPRRMLVWSKDRLPYFVIPSITNNMNRWTCIYLIMTWSWVVYRMLFNYLW